MANFTQEGRPIAITTPLGPDALLLEKFISTEAISELFRCELQMLAERPVDFNQLMGQSATLRFEYPNGAHRFLNGIIVRISQGGHVGASQGKNTFLRYGAELVPLMWRLTRRTQSRIFQQLSVPDILQQILRNEWKLNLAVRIQGTYKPRNYCVQYRETDFAFVSRIMEEAGIWYFFEHTADSHTLVLTDVTATNPVQNPAQPVPYDEIEGHLDRVPSIRQWEKIQDLCTCQFSVRDYNFQMPQSNLLAQQAIQTDAVVGTVNHTLEHGYQGPSGELQESYDFPGGYGTQFDGVDATGGDQADQLQNLFTENTHRVRVRAERAASHGLFVHGSGTCGHFVPGHTFTLDRHFDADGDYLLTRVENTVTLEGAYTGSDPAHANLLFENHFHCIPTALPYRSAAVTPRPRIEGFQTAVVVGPAGVEIFLDKYGRVKVQFHWDRQGNNDGSSSCWVRVAQFWAGKTWGAFFWPRIAHEVVVAFEEGDPDRPLIVGSVYNAVNMPPTDLPGEGQYGGIKSCIFGGDPASNFNAIVFHDPANEEYVQIHSEKNAVNNSESYTYEYNPRAGFSFNGSLPLGD